MDKKENSITLDKSMMQKVIRFSKKTGESVESIADSAFKRYFYELKEDLKDEKIAKRISSKIASGKMKTFSLEEVKKEFGL